MATLPQYLYTPSGFEKLKSELEYVQNSRAEAVATLAHARGLGDLSENGLYKAAKARLAGIDYKIARLKFQIKMAKVVEREISDEIAFGSLVLLAKSGKMQEIEIVGDYEADPKQGKISYKSPLGSELMGKRKGDQVSIAAPKGSVKYSVEAVE